MKQQYVGNSDILPKMANLTRVFSRKIPMTMADWTARLDAFLQFNQRDVLDDFGKVAMEVAKSFALSEFEQYRVVQDRLFQSDFDKLLIDSKGSKSQ